MKAKSIIKLVLGGAIGAYCLYCAYLMGQIKGMRDAIKMLKDSFENAQCKEEKHD